MPAKKRGRREPRDGGQQPSFALPARMGCASKGEYKSEAARGKALTQKDCRSCGRRKQALRGIGPLRVVSGARRRLHGGYLVQL